jgi:uncharacterized protein
VLAELCPEGTELLTLVRGAEASADDLEPLVEDLRARLPGLEVLRLDGGQGTYSWLFGAE